MSAQDQPPGEGWWKASDGNWYAPHLHPDAQQTPNPPAPAAPNTSAGTVPPATPEPSGRGKTWLLGLGALAVTAAVGIAAFVVLGGNDDEAVDDVLTGEELWQVEAAVTRGLDDDDFETAPELLVAQDGVVVVGPPTSLPGDIVALDAETGDVLWDRPLRGVDVRSFPVPPPVVLGDTLLFASLDGDREVTYEWQAVGLADGVRRWRMDGLEPFARPLGDGNVLLFERDRGPVVVASDSGDELWSARQRGLVAGVHRNIVAFADLDGSGDDAELVALDTENGEELWRIDLRVDFDVQQSVTVFGRPSDEVVDALIVLAGDELLALDVENGEELWRSAALPEGAQALVEPRSGVIVVCGGLRGVTEFRVLDLATGELQWDVTAETESDLGGGAVVAVDEDVLVIAENFGGCLNFSNFAQGPALAYATADGTEVWRDDTEGIYAIERPLGELFGARTGDITTFVREGDGERAVIDLATGDVLAIARAERGSQVYFAGTTRVELDIEDRELIVAGEPPIDLPGLPLDRRFVDGVLYVATTGGHVVAVD